MKREKIRTKEWYEAVINKMVEKKGEFFTNDDVHLIMTEVDRDFGSLDKTGKHYKQIEKLIQTGGFTVLPDDTRKGRGREKPILLEITDEKKVREGIDSPKKEPKIKSSIHVAKEIKAPVKPAKDKRINRTHLEKLYNILVYVKNNHNPCKIGKLKEATKCTKKDLEAYIAEAYKLGVFIEYNPETEEGVKFKSVEGAIVDLATAYEKLYEEPLPYKKELKIESAKPVIRREYVAPAPIKSEKTVIEYGTTDHDLIYLTGGIIRSSGTTSRIRLADICTTIKNMRGDYVDPANLKQLISGVKELSLETSFGTEKVFLSNGEESWKKIKAMHGPEAQNKVQILVRYHSSLEHLREIFGDTVEVVVKINDYDNIYLIKTNTDEMSMEILRDFIASFRTYSDPEVNKVWGDFFLTKLSLFEKLQRDIKKKNALYRESSKRYYIDSEGWLEAEVMKK